MHIPDRFDSAFGCARCSCARAFGKVRSILFITAVFFSAWLAGVPCLRAEIGVSCRNDDVITLDTPSKAAFSLVLTNGYGDCYRMNLLRNRDNYQAYRGICSYRGFSLSGCSTTGEVVMLRIKETPSMPEYSSILSTSLRWGTTMYVLNDLFHPLCSWVQAGYENWYPFDMSCSVAMYLNSGGYGASRLNRNYAQPDLLANSVFSMVSSADRFEMFGSLGASAPAKTEYSLVMTNGYGDCYRMNLLRNRDNYQAYRGICSYRGFSLSGCSTTGEVVMLRIKATPSMPEHFSLVSTSLRWGTTMYFLNDVFRPLCSWVSAGYENWYPFDMSCSVAMYINSGGYGAGREEARAEPVKAIGRSKSLVLHDDGGTNLIGALLPLTGDLADIGAAYQSALTQAMQTITNTPGMPPIRLVIADTRTDAGVAYGELAALRSNGCHIVIGPETSEECRILKIFANENDVLLLSSSSTATPLALPDDNLMRLVPDDSRHAAALADLLAADGITDIAILARTDIYGEGFMAALGEAHRARGGVVFASNYWPRATNFIPEIVSNMAGQVAVRSAARGANRVGVVAILFDEGVTVLREAAMHPVMGTVRWYGGDGLAQNNLLLADDQAAAFAARTRFVGSIAGGFTNPLYAVVASNIALETNCDAVRSYPMRCYDGISIVAEVLKLYGGTQTMAELIGRIETVAGNYAGCTGPISFNDAHDRADGAYEFYELHADGGALRWDNLAGKVAGAPGYVEASQGAYADRIKVWWAPVSGATGYELWGALTAQTADAVKLAEVADSEYWLTGVPADTLGRFWVKAKNASGTSAFSAIATGWAARTAGPCVRINGSRNPVTMLSADAYAATAEMNPGAYAGFEADWWVLVNTPGGWYYLDAAGQLRPAAGGAFTPAYQGPLCSMPATEIMRGSGLAAGDFTFYFGVDPRDGVLDPTHTWYADNVLSVY